MSGSRRRVVGVVAGVCGACVAGCHRGGGFILLNLLTGQKPVSIALVTDSPLAPLNPFSPYDQMRAALEEQTGRPVALDLCLPFQIEVGLAGGFHQFAFVTPAQYVQMRDASRFEVVAVSADGAGRVERPGLLIVKSNSPIGAVEELRGKVVAFGPRSDSRTHCAALELLRERGLKPTDLQLEVLPLPGSLKHMPDDRAVAQTVLAMSSDAGFVDQAYWERLPQRATEAGEPDRTGLRVIAETRALPDQMLIASPGAEPALVEQVRAFLLRSATEHPKVLEPLRVSGYRPVREGSVAAWVHDLPVVESSGPPGEEEPAPREGSPQVE